MLKRVKLLEKSNKTLTSTVSELKKNQDLDLKLMSARMESSVIKLNATVGLMNCKKKKHKNWAIGAQQC